MNFYISSSSRAKLFIAVLTFVLLTVALDGALELYAARKTSKDRWIENKIYKSAHLSKRDPGETDYIFIGSSRTIFHISTAVFADYDQRIYNFGVSGMTLYDFPYFAQKAAAQKPKTIVLNISVNDLFSDNSEKKDLFDETTAIDLLYIYATQPWDIKLPATKGYFRSFHRLLIYNKAIYVRLKQLFGTFSVNKNEDVQAEDPSMRVNSLKPDYQALADCRIFDYNAPSKYKTVAKCENGDGILFGHYIPVDFKGTQGKLSGMNEDYIRLLNKILDDIQATHIQPIVVLEPIFQSRLVYNLDQIKQKLHTKTVIDLTGYPVPREDWADTGHLNHKGRHAYTKHLAKTLQSAFSESK